MSQDSYLLEVNQISSGYDVVQVLWDIDIKVKSEESICIIGSNGAGKSTLIRNIMGLKKPWDGNIYFRESEITELGSDKRVSMGLSLVPEERELFPALSVEDNLLLGSHLRNDDNIEDSLNMVYDLFPTIEEYRHRLVGGLSGGERQMCAIGRALMADPELLIIDELSLGLAPVIMDDLLEMLTSIIEEGDLTLILVEQDVDAALEITDRGYVMEQGRNVLSGDTSDLAEDEQVKDAYLGVR